MTAIFGYAACEARLRALLAEVDQNVGAASGAVAKAKSANDGANALVDFTNDSRANDPTDAVEVAAIAKLDDLARRTADDLSAMAISGLVMSIASRAQEIEAIGEALKKQTLVNLDDAKRLRLEPLRDAIDRITDTVAGIKVLAKSLDKSQPDEAAIATAAADLVDRLAAVRKAIAGLQV